jgi:hypothetical protein
MCNECVAASAPKIIRYALKVRAVYSLVVGRAVSASARMNQQAILAPASAQPKDGKVAVFGQK